jgi:predicted enzyme related to lactoylglutathione lyase
MHMALLIDEIVFDCTDPRRVAAFWAAALAYEIVQDRGDWIVLHAAHSAGPLLAFDTVPEPKVVKNRVHLDLTPAAGDTMEAEVARLEELGATAVRRVTNGPDSVHTVMRDPEGNEFCVLRP